MSSDNYNMIIQLPSGKWIMSPNHNMTRLMQDEERDAYKRALKNLHPDDTETEYATQEEAYAAADEESTEYGTFSHEYKEYFNEPTS